jgi:hypothetical protein
MRNAFIVAGIVAMTSWSSAQQTATQYVISTHVLAGSPLQGGAVETLAAPTFRVPAGRPATMDLGDARGSLRLAVTPSDLGAGRAALRVVAETRHGERIQRSTFDLLTGSDASTPTVALRDGAGAFMLDKQGRPLFMEFQVLIRR